MDSFNWTRLDSKYLVQDKWLSLRADTCQLPDGGIVEPFYVFEYSPWVNVVAITKNQEVVLVEQYRHGIQKTVLELPGGSMDSEDIWFFRYFYGSYEILANFSNYILMMPILKI